MAGIFDVTSGKLLFNEVENVPTVHATATAAYTAWAAELGVSNTVTLPGIITGDDSSTEIDLGFIYSTAGNSSKLMQSTEGSLGFYTDEPVGTITNRSLPLTAILPTQVSVGRNYTSRNTNPTVVMNCKVPAMDAGAFNVKWQKTADAAILFITWASFGSATTNNCDVAVLIKKGYVEFVCTPAVAGVYFQMFLMTLSANSVAGVGNLGYALTQNVTSTFKTAVPFSISGTVTGVDSLPLVTAVRAYDIATGALVGSTLSNAMGDYSMEVLSADPCYVVCVAPADYTVSSLIIDKVLPVEP